MNEDTITITITISDIDPRTWAKIERRAKAENRTPESVAEFFLEHALGPSCKSNTKVRSA